MSALFSIPYCDACDIKACLWHDTYVLVATEDLGSRRWTKTVLVVFREKVPSKFEPGTLLCFEDEEPLTELQEIEGPDMVEVYRAKEIPTVRYEQER